MTIRDSSERVKNEEREREKIVFEEKRMKFQIGMQYLTNFSIEEEATIVKHEHHKRANNRQRLYANDTNDT